MNRSVSQGHTRATLQNLAQQGFRIERRTKVPLLKIFSETTPDAAADAVQGDVPLRVSRGDQRIECSGAAQLETVALAADTGSIDVLAGLKSKSQQEVLTSLSAKSPEQQRANLLRMAENTVLPDNLAGQLAQWAGTEVDQVKINRVPDLGGMIPNEQELAELTEQARELKLDDDYLVDGCQARGHLRTDFLRDAGINRGKLFVKGRLRLTDAKLKKNEEGEVETAPIGWKFHTAPFALVETDEKTVEPRVWDPNVAKVLGAESEWLHPKDWLNSFGSKSPVTITVESEAKYSPHSLFTGSLSSTTRTAQEDDKAYKADAVEFRKEQLNLEQLLKQQQAEKD